MASQRRAPTKRPPRPAAKKPPPPPGASDGQDVAEGATGKTTTNGAKTATNGSKTAKAAAPGATKSAASGTKSTTSGATKSASSGSAKSGTATTAKDAPAGSAPKPSTSGPNYRPPTGAARSASRRPPPPPRRKKKKLTKQTIGALVALALIGTLVVFFSLAVNGSSSPTAVTTATGPEQVAVPSGPVLAAPDAAQYPAAIDGIQCETTEQLKYHIHAHLTIFVNGKARQVPYGIGIDPPLQYSATNGGVFVSSGKCFYWIHTHAADGIIHIESPTSTIYTLGEFFDDWGQPLKSGQVGPAVGQLTIFVNGKPFTGDPRTIPLNAHDQIQLDVGSPAPPQTLITFPSGL